MSAATHSNSASDKRTNTLSGGCHCGKVRFQVRSPAVLGEQAGADASLSVKAPSTVPANGPEKLSVKECNCSICQLVGYLHWIVPAADFELLSPWEELSLYTFNTAIAQHWFCPNCGVKSFYRPRSHPTGISVNARCLDGLALSDLAITPFDGRNWERNHATLAPLPEAN